MSEEEEMQTIPPLDAGIQGASADDITTARIDANASHVSGTADGGPGAGAAVQLDAPRDETSETAASPDDESAEDLQPISTEQEAELRNIIEALIFASDEPISTKFLRQIIDDVNKDRVEENRIRATTDGIKKSVAAINNAYSDRAFHITPIAGGFVFATKAKYSAFVGKLAKEKARRKLSATAIESLAIIAYKQPITKSEVEFIRGVNADYIIKTLLEKNLITITGRASTPGRPLLYGTTDEFLKHFGLNEITDLPKPREIEELIGETELEVEKRMLAEQQELEFKDELAQKMEGGAKPAGSRAPLRQNASRVPLHDAAAAAPAGAPSGDVPPVPDAVPASAHVDIDPELQSREPAAETAALGAIGQEPPVGEPIEEKAEQSEQSAEPEIFLIETVFPPDDETIPADTMADDTLDDTPAYIQPVVTDAADDAEAMNASIHDVPIVNEPAYIQTVVTDAADDAEAMNASIHDVPIVNEPVFDDAVDTETADDVSPVEEPVLTETLDADPMQSGAAVEEPAIEPPAADEAAPIEPVEVESSDVEAAAEEMTEPDAIVEDAVIIETSIEHVPDEIGHASASPEETRGGAVITEPAALDDSATADAGTASTETESDRHAGSVETDETTDAAASGTEPTPEKGWSKWKTKIKTFFKKLFV